MYKNQNPIQVFTHVFISKCNALQIIVHRQKSINVQMV